MRSYGILEMLFSLALIACGVFLVINAGMQLDNLITHRTSMSELTAAAIETAEYNSFCAKGNTYVVATATTASLIRIKLDVCGVEKIYESRRNSLQFEER